MVADVTQRTPKELLAPRLADGLTPPTNRWYSGLVFGDKPEPVFPLPLGFALTGDGFAFGLPRVSAGPSTIAGGFVADVTVGLGAARSVVSSNDASVVVLDNLGADGKLIGRTTIAQGSPFVSFVAATDMTLTIPESFSPAGEGWAVATIGGVRYALAADGVDGGKVTVGRGARGRLLAGARGSRPGGAARSHRPGDRVEPRITSLRAKG